MTDRSGKWEEGWNDHDAFRRFYQTHAPRIYALCLRLTGDPVRAGDATQDVFVRAWRTAGYEERGRLESWLNRIAINAIRDRLRSERRRPAVPLEDAFRNPSHSPHLIEDRLTLERAIANLPDRARQVLVLHDIEGYRIREIADLQGITAGTVKSQLHRARYLLQEALK